MAEIKPLTLRAERATSKQPVSERLPYARVLVDTPAFHLEALLDYSVPQSMDGSITEGVLVEVPYGHGSAMGIVLERMESVSISGQIKQVTKVLSQLPVSNSAHIAFLQQIAANYGCQPWDIVRSAIPTPVATSTKKFIQAAASEVNFQPDGVALPEDLPEELVAWLQGGQLRALVQLPITRPYWNVVVDIISIRIQKSPVLLVVPDERDIRILTERFAGAAIPANVLTSSQRKSERFFNYLQLLSGRARLTISTRSGILAPLPKEATLFVLDDADPAHYERKAPTWNTREIALSRTSEYSVVFLSLAPSYELLEECRNGALPMYQFPKAAPLSLTFSEETHSSRAHHLVGRALKKGPVLLRTPASGYIASFSCQKCRNIAYCSCGGKLYFRSQGNDPRCHLCDRVWIDWQCSFCSEKRPRVATAGAERLAQEYARSFPGVPVHFSQADHPIDFLGNEPQLVLSTAGVEPVAAYQGLALMDLQASLGQTSMRATELTRLSTLRVISLLSSGGEIFCNLAESHPFSQELMRRSFLESSLADSEQRSEVNLPPKSRIIVCTAQDLQPLINAVKKIEPKVEIIGPIPDSQKLRLVLKVSMAGAPDLITRLYEVNRVLSLHKSELITYYIDPYEI